MNEDDKKFCDQEISKTELRDIVKNLKRNKAPGLDGLTNEFYQTFWDKLEPYFIKMLQESFTGGIFPHSIRKAIMTLIFKQGDKTNLSNYRPISLTNSDYKIIAFVLSKRLQKVAAALISDHQTGYIKNTYTGFNSRLLNDIIENCETNNKPGAIICLDFEKGFDSLHWGFMLETLHKFGFGENFICWVKLLYSSPLFCIKNNGWISEEIIMERGVRQGCPLSALLFILAIEILSFEIKENKLISGIKIGSEEYRILQYADDSTLTLKDNMSITESIRILTSFSEISGLRLNTKKCQGLWLGQLKGNEDVFEKIQFMTEPIKCLGIYIGTDIEKCKNKNWENKITSIQQLLLKWSNRKLTIFGKVAVINSLVIPKLIYNFSVLTTPVVVIESLNKLIFDYIWGKNHKVRRATIIGDYENGGLKIVDLESKINAIKTSFIPKFFENNSLSQILKHYLSELGFDLQNLLKMNFKSAKSFEIIQKLPYFYQEIFISYNSCKILKPADQLKSYELMTETIWGNEYFKQKHKTLYFETWIKSGFIFVKDLFQNDGIWRDEIDILHSLHSTRNWIAEYMTLKKVIGKVIRHHDIKSVCYVQKPLLQRLIFTVNGKKRKFERPYTEKMWEHILCLKFS